MSKRPGSELDSEPAAGSDAKQPRLDAAANGNAENDGDKQAKPAFDQVPAGTPKLKYEMEPLFHLGTLFKQGTKLVEVVLQGDLVSNNNKQVKSRQLWGDGTYTFDSDVAAVLMHAGFVGSVSAAMLHQVQQFHTLLSLHDCTKNMVFPSAFRNSVRSRAWYGEMDEKRGCAFKVERCWLVSRSGHKHELKAVCADQAVTHPTFQPNSSDRQMNLRSAAGSSRAKNLQEVAILYNLVNEPWLKYSSMAIADRGLKSSQWTSVRLREEVLYMETTRQRYELTYAGPSTPEAGQHVQDTYTLSHCKKVLPLALMKRRGIPMPADHGEVLETGLTWEELKWGNATLQVRDRELKLLRINFFARTSPNPAEGQQ